MADIAEGAEEEIPQFPEVLSIEARRWKVRRDQASRIACQAGVSEQEAFEEIARR